MSQTTQLTTTEKDPLEQRTRELFSEELLNNYKRTDRLFAGLMAFQWVAATVIALSVSPRAWEGTVSAVHIHVWAALLLGGGLTIFPICMALYYPGRTLTRHVIACSQMLMSALLIHLSGGRIETHFHVFGSLAFLAFYRDWRVLITASLVVALDHGVRGIFWPQSVYGVSIIEPWRWLEHTGWVVFEDTFLTISIRQNLAALWESAYRRCELEQVNQLIEGKVIERTAELQAEIAERKLAEVNLAESNKQLEDLSKDLEKSRDHAIMVSRFKSEFLANMSHEIRTPLNAVIGMSDLLMRTPLSDQQIEYSAVIHNSAGILLGVVNDVLDYSKIESGRLDLEIIDFDIVETVESAAELVVDRAQSKELSLSTFVDPKIPSILRGDPGRIRQVLLNFLSNSIKFTDRGEIVIRAVCESQSEKKITIRFSVTDTGIGLSASALDRLFEPFTQADASVTRKYGGTGLGLAISKRLVDLMEGKLEYNSVYGEGSTFSFIVELETSPQQPPEDGGRRDVLQGKRVLIVEGSPGVQQALSAYLTSFGMRFSSATDVDKASLMLRRESAAIDPFDLVIACCPIADALELIDQVRRQPQMAEVNFLAIGNFSERKTANQFLEAGFSACLHLPVRKSKLLDIIIALICPSGAISDQKSESTKAGTRELPEPESRNLILVVEDNPINQKVALLQLRDLGFSAHAVGNGTEAVEAVSRTEYALILMDCQMPEMDGLQATKEIRKMEALTGKYSPIVAMTAHAMESDRLDCLSAGMDDYLSKPVTQKKLGEVVDRWLGRRSGQQQTADGYESPTGGHSLRPIELDILRSTYGAKVARDMLMKLPIQVEEGLKKLRGAVKDRDAAVVHQAVHKFKGQAATVYATELANLSRTLEEESSKEPTDWSSIESQLGMIVTAWKRTEKFLNAKTAEDHFWKSPAEEEG